MAGGDSAENCFATPGSVFAIIDNIHLEISLAKHNKAYVQKFVPIVKQITKVLNGADAKFVRQAEFYSDLKETLQKILRHLHEVSARGKWMNKLMAKKDQKNVEEFDQHVDLLITRIVFAFAQRVQLMKGARKGDGKHKLEPINEGQQHPSIDGSEEELTGERWKNNWTFELFISWLLHGCFSPHNVFIFSSVFAS